jgi:uncharacterized membrane protein
MHNHGMEDRRGEQLATALGWFSIALGATELIAPRTVARMTALEDSSTSTIRTFGALKVGSGLAILAAQRFSSTERGATLNKRSAMSVHVEEVATINKPVGEVYRSWKKFENFPSFMRHLESVHMLNNGRSRWRATAPAGTTVEWEAEMVEDREGELIAWRSVEGSQIQNSGTVQFRPAPGARGTELRVRLDYRPPAGRLGRGIAWLFGEEPEQQIRDDLRRFKQLLETGEIAVSDGTGLWRPARPASAPSKRGRWKDIYSAEEGSSVTGVRS